VATVGTHVMEEGGRLVALNRQRTHNGAYGTVKVYRLELRSQLFREEGLVLLVST
jgi:hypothetical protein